MKQRAAKSRELLIRDRRQIRALVSPIRQEIVDALEAAGPCSIAELARQLGRPADGIYFHIRRLRAVGLLVECERRPSGRRPATIYDVAGRPVRMERPTAHVAETRRVLLGALRLGARDLTRAFGGRESIVAGRRRTLTGGRVKGWLSGPELERLNGLLDEMLKLLRAGRPARGRRLLSFAWALAPALRPRGGPNKGERT